MKVFSSLMLMVYLGLILTLGLRFVVGSPRTHINKYIASLKCTIFCQSDSIKL